MSADARLTVLVLALQRAVERRRVEITELLLWGNDFGRAAAAEFDALLHGPFLYNSVKTDLATYTVDGVICIAHAP